jgi:hypothetical protein
VKGLVVVEHGEIQTVDIRDVPQLTARDIADARAFDHSRNMIFRTGFDRLLLGRIVKDRIDLAQRKAGHLQVGGNLSG